MTPKRPTLLPFALCLLPLALLGSLAWARDWTWQLPNERYKQLNLFQRAQYDRAADTLNQGNYQGAASEFEKFKVQFPDAPILPYIVLLRGYCLHKAKQRNQAIKVYHEVLDYFADSVGDAAPAQYFMGLAHLENGDVREGVQCLSDMIADEDYRKHPLAAGALARLAEIHWRKKEVDQAVKYWKQIVADFSESSHTEANQARHNLTVYYIKQKDYAAYDAWLVTPENRDDPKARVWIALNVIDRAYHNVFPGHLNEYSRFEQKERWAAMKACFDYYAAQKPWFEKADDLWNYYTRAIQFLANYYQDKKVRDKCVDDIVAIIKKIADKKDANSRYAWLIDRLREGGDYERARYCIGLMTDPPYAAYKDCELLIAQTKWPEAIARLQQVEAMGNEYWTATAQDRRAWIYKDCIQQYEKAIELYRAINKPPATLWYIQECYMRMGKLDEAVTTLSELENSFPDQAPRAAWYKASYYHEAKQAKQAIAQARKILKAYKASPEASSAHQLLEQYGIATGGGVFEEE